MIYSRQDLKQLLEDSQLPYFIYFVNGLEIIEIIGYDRDITLEISPAWPTLPILLS